MMSRDGRSLPPAHRQNPHRCDLCKDDARDGPVTPPPGPLIELRVCHLDGIAADVVGHEKETMTHGLYSDGSSTAQKLKAISKETCPAPLDRP